MDSPPVVSQDDGQRGCFASDGEPMRIQPFRKVAVGILLWFKGRGGFRYTGLAVGRVFVGVMYLSRRHRVGNYSVTRVFRKNA